MEDARIDEYGRQLCPEGAVLQLVGAWRYNGEIVPGKYSFVCETAHTGSKRKCWRSFVGDTKETEAHIAGCKAAKMQEEVNKIKKEYGNK